MDRRPWLVRIAAGFLVCMALAALVGPLLMGAGASGVSGRQFEPPGWSHPFGTDVNGRDVLYRVLTGARISLVVGLCGAVVSLVIGTAYGLIAGYAGGKVDAVMMRVVDIFYAVPRLIIVLVFINAFDPVLRGFLDRHEFDAWIPFSKIGILIVCLGLIEWLTMARVIRGQVLVLKTQQYVTAARALGQSHFRILVRHLLPNLSGLVVVYLTLTIPAVILDESFLSFLGLGIQAPQASWGTLLSDGAGVINPVVSRWWLLLFPALAMSATLLALNFLGDTLRDRFDPRSRRR